MPSSPSAPRRAARHPRFGQRRRSVVPASLTAPRPRLPAVRRLPLAPLGSAAPAPETN